MKSLTGAGVVPTSAVPQESGHHQHHGSTTSSAELLTEPRRHGGLAGARDAIGAVLGAALGLLPHLLHHVSLFAGALVITGAAGNLLFGALGILLSIPLLRRLYRRFGTWKAPGLALVAFAAMFSMSAFVIGPALTGADSDATPTPPASDTSKPGTPSGSVDHDGHHGG